MSRTQNSRSLSNLKIAMLINHLTPRTAPIRNGKTRDQGRSSHWATVNLGAIEERGHQHRTWWRSISCKRINRQNECRLKVMRRKRTVTALINFSRRRMKSNSRKDWVDHHYHHQQSQCARALISSGIPSNQPHKWRRKEYHCWEVQKAHKLVHNSHHQKHRTFSIQNPHPKEPYRKIKSLQCISLQRLCHHNRLLRVESPI